MESYKNTNSLAPIASNNSPILPTLQPRFFGLIGAGPQIELLGNRLFSYTLAVCVSLILSSCHFLPLLYRFFSQILDNTLTTWARNYPPSNQVVLEAGKIRIEFGCAMTEPVPWEFIAEMALSGRDAVERGFMPFFAKQWWWLKNGTEADPDSGRLCYVGIRVVENGRVVVPPEL